MRTEDKTGQKSRRPAEESKPVSRPAGKKKQVAVKKKSRRPESGRKLAEKAKRSTEKRTDALKSPERTGLDVKRRRTGRNNRNRGATALAAARRRDENGREAVPEVVYTPPKQFNRNRFLLQMATMLAVVLALSFVFSIFFKVRTITVAGANKYDVWTVREASGLQEGDGLLTFGQAKVAGRIKTALPYVKDVRVGIKLPDTVNIEIVESEVAYSISAYDGTWWLMTAEGRILEQVDAAKAEQVSTVMGIQLAVPVGAQAVAYEEVTQNAFGETLEAGASAKERMGVVQQILQSLEKNGQLGTVRSLDISNPSELTLWIGDQYEVILGDDSRLDYKVTAMQSVFLQEEYLEPGTMDVSFDDEDHPNDVVFIPFSEQ